jgi:hypothetical protein
MRRSFTRQAGSLLAAALFSACHSASPVSPSTTPVSASSTATPSTVAGRLVDALTGAPLPSVTITMDDGGSSVTGADGGFLLSADETGLCSVSIGGPGVVGRETTLHMPSSNASLSLIPSQFDLATFDQMYRAEGTLHRWVVAPALVIVDAVLQFTNESDASYVALGERLTAEERASIAADLSWGLPQATGGAFAGFASVSVESPAAGSSVSLSRDGSIVVARFSGLSLRPGHWGYGRAARRSDAVSTGAVLIDRDFDVARTKYGRSLRVHELGHALGYAHVTRRASFMNAAATVEPNGFDRDAATVAYQRQPGNQCPDRDPTPGRIADRSTGGLQWSVILP